MAFRRRGRTGRKRRGRRFSKPKKAYNKYDNLIGRRM